MTGMQQVEQPTLARIVGHVRRNAGLLGGGAAVAGAALLLAGGLVSLQGFAPAPTIWAGVEYALGSPTSVARTIAWALPLYVATLGVALAFRSQMFNIGAEGQIYAGAMGAAIAGAYIGPVLAPVHITLALGAAGFVGGLIAAGLGWLRAHWGVDEVLSTLLSNYVVVLFTTYLATGPLRDPGRQSGTTRPIQETASFTEVVPRTGLTGALVVVALLAVVVWWLSEVSTTGYRWRMTGESDAFAAAVGFDVARARVTSMAISGALCGVAGGLLVTASQGRFWTGIGTGIGWDAVLLALISRARPRAAVVWVTVYAVMRAAARGIEQVSDVPSELSLILISVVIVLAVARSGIADVLRSWTARYQDRGV